MRHDIHASFDLERHDAGNPVAQFVQGGEFPSARVDVGKDAVMKDRTYEERGFVGAKPIGKAQLQRIGTAQLCRGLAKRRLVGGSCRVEGTAGVVSRST